MLLALFAALLWSSSTMASEPGCGVYRQVERACACGPEGYALGYGLKYCRRFAAEDRFSRLGRQWRDEIVACLQERLRAAMPRTGCDCRAIRRSAYASHYACYAEASVSICDLPARDIVLIERSIERDDKRDARGLALIARLAARCFAYNPENARAAAKAIRRARTRK